MVCLARVGMGDGHRSVAVVGWVRSRMRVFLFVRQGTAYSISECDWSAGVCSSDLLCNSLCGFGAILITLRVYDGTHDPLSVLDRKSVV